MTEPLQARVLELEADNADLQATFDLVYAASQRGIKAWQAAHPGNDLVWPDQANMVEWLCDRVAELEAEHARRADVLKAEHVAAADALLRAQERLAALEKLVGSRARKIERLHAALSALIAAAERRKAADLGGASLLGPDLAAARAALAGTEGK